MLQRINKLKPFKKVIFTLLIGLSVVAFWRGAWGIMDTYILPNNPELSYWSSILIGLFILYLTNHWTKELV
jgi:hypothetical protein